LSVSFFEQEFCFRVRSSSPGGVYYLSRQGDEAVEYRHFQSVPAVDRSLGSILHGALALRPRSVIQLGVLLLIATPIARVALSLVGFALERDRMYVLITAIVLITLVYGLVTGAVSG
jgi:uncharacterized membrane protein